MVEGPGGGAEGGERRGQKNGCTPWGKRNHFIPPYSAGHHPGGWPVWGECGGTMSISLTKGLRTSGSVFSFFSVNSKSRWCSVCCHCLVHCPPAHSMWLFLHFSTSGSFTSLPLFSTCYYIRTSSLSNRRHNDNVTDYDGRHFKCNDQTYWRRGISEVGIKILTLPFLVHLV